MLARRIRPRRAPAPAADPREFVDDEALDGLAAGESNDDGGAEFVRGGRRMREDISALSLCFSFSGGTGSAGIEGLATPCRTASGVLSSAAEEASAVVSLGELGSARGGAPPDTVAGALLPFMLPVGVSTGSAERELPISK